MLQYFPLLQQTSYMLINLDDFSVQLRRAQKLRWYQVRTNLETKRCERERLSVARNAIPTGVHTEYATIVVAYGYCQRAVICTSQPPWSKPSRT